MGDEPPIPPHEYSPEAHPPGPFEHYPFTPEQARHVALMGAIAQELTSRTGYAFVLKGGPPCFCPVYPQVLPLMRYNFGESST